MNKNKYEEEKYVMRALLKDKEDSTLIAIEVTEAVYDPEEQILSTYETRMPVIR